MDAKLLERYYRGECSPEEVEQILDWFAREELAPEQEQQLYQWWEEQEPAGDDFTRRAGHIFAGIAAATAAGAQQPGPLPARAAARPPARRRQQWWAAAAVLLLPLAFGWLYFVFSPGRQPAAGLVAVEAPAGIRKTVHLADGSRIFLHSGSKLVYPKHFSAHKREVTLSGEAFFEVAHDRRRPFTVRTGPLLTRVLGTSFNIRYRQKDKQIAVALATGAVTVATPAGGQPARLAPGQQLVYDRRRHDYQVSAYDAGAVLGWRQGVLHFRNASLNQVLDQLATWYGVDIEVAGTRPAKGRDWHYTGSYQRQSLDHVLEGIAFVQDFTYKRKGKKVTIKLN
jgi:ferric-dicitrate binding protein FerR (iron transport regulator)